MFTSPFIRSFFLTLVLLFSAGTSSAQMHTQSPLNQNQISSVYPVGNISRTDNTRIRRSWDQKLVYCDTERQTQLFEYVTFTAENKALFTLAAIAKCLKSLEKTPYSLETATFIPPMFSANVGSLRCSYVAPLDKQGYVTLRYALGAKVSQTDVDMCLAELEALQKKAVENFTPCQNCNKNSS